MNTFRLNLISLLVIFSLGQLARTESFSAPTLEKGLPKELDLPKGFKPQKNAKSQNFVFPRTSAIILAKQGTTHPIYVKEVKRGIFPGKEIQAGDVIVAVNGKAFGQKATNQFAGAHGKAKKDQGFLWFTRWRNGKMEQIFLDLGTHVLDLTKTGRPGTTRDWRLGPIGANGWCYHERSKSGASAKARQIIITSIDKDAPAARKLKVGDVLVGTDGGLFQEDARKALAKAIDFAESEAMGGNLNLRVWRPDSKQTTGKELTGEAIQVTLNLPILGRFSETTPYNCPKTDLIIDQAVTHIIKNKDTLLKPEGWINFINGLGLLATGREDVLPVVREMAHGSLLKEGESLSVEKHVSMMCWWWSYKTVFLSEYYLRTKDKAVVPTLLEYATKISMGQSGVGTWGHTYAAKENTGYLHGNLGGYGAINQQGITLMIALALADKGGIKHPEITDALKRGRNFFSYFIGKGTIPYGDHGAANSWYDDNGKSGAAAIYFDLIGESEGPDFFSKMVLASTPSGRESGHTGHFWSRLWGGIGAAQGGKQLTQAFYKELNWAYILERQPGGRFAFQENAGESGNQGDSKTKWDSTGSRLLQLCAPRRALHITGKESSTKKEVSSKRIEEILSAGRLNINTQARSKLTMNQILDLLKDPLPPTRSIGAKVLAEREINCVEILMEMLDSKNPNERYGAAEALSKAGYGNEPAAKKLIRLMADDKDILFKTYAIAALINRDKAKGLLTVAKPAIPVLLKMALVHSPDDPRKVLQHDIARALFYGGRAQPRRGLLPEYGLEGVDRKLLIPVVKEVLTNLNGWARSTCASYIYPKLTKDELNQLWGDIYMASRYIAPSGIMFASGARTQGLSTMAEHNIKEGLDLAAWYIRYQKGHGSSGRVPAAISAIQKYGHHAKEVIPQLESHAKYYEEKAAKVRKRRKAAPKPEDPDVRLQKAIEKIQSAKESNIKLISISDRIARKHLPPSP